MKKNNEKNVIKGFKAVKFMREVRDKISFDIKDMDFEQIEKYFETRRLEVGTENKNSAQQGKKKISV
jgi:hypothetical protein